MTTFHATRSLMCAFRGQTLAVLVALICAPMTMSSQQATPSAKILTFNAAAVGLGASAQTLTVSFAVTGGGTPAATLHYGHDYSLGALACTGGASQTCTVTVTFQPILPGPRKDAIFLMNGTTRLATVLLGGVGQAPMSLVQPGSFSTSIPSSIFTTAGFDYIYQSVTDENGIVYVLASGNAKFLYSVTKAGVATQISLTNPPYYWTIGIDGAGVLYLFGDSATVTTYDTVQGIQGTYTIPSAGSDIYWYPGVVSEDGTIYVVDQIPNNGTAEEFKPNGSIGYAITLNPGVLQPFTAAVDSAGNLFVGGYSINEITPAGVQTQVNTIGANAGLAVDAADTLYATRYSPTGGVAELPASNYTTPIASIDTRSAPLGMSLGSDGTVYVSNYLNLDIFDRYRTETIDFGEVDPNTSSTVSTGTVYNGGNQPLTILGFTLSGAGFSLDPKAANECAFGMVLAPGALCQASVVFSPTHPGTFSGTISVSSNSLNGANTIQTIQLVGTSDGSYDVLTPSPLVFAPQALGTSQTQPVTLTNQGNSYASTVYSVATNNPAFTISQGSCAGVAVQVGASCQLQVSFAPTAVQTYTGTATIDTYVSGTAQPHQTITLSFSGPGVGPVAATPVISPGAGSYSSSQQVTITDSTSNATVFYTTDGSTPTPSSTKYTGAITVSSSEILKAIATATGYSNSAVASASYTLTTPALSHTPASLGFGNVPTGDTSSSMSVTVSNIGSLYSLNLITTISNPAFAAVSGSTCGSSVAPGSSCQLTLAFTPAAVQAYNATVTIAASSPGCPGCVFPSDSFAVTGTGIVQPPVLTISPASLTFGNQIVNTTSAAQSVTLTNNSQTDTVVLSSFFTTSSLAILATSPNCSSPLAPGMSCTVSVTFSPSAIQAYSGTVTLQPQPSGCGGCVRNYPAQTIAVTGAGIAQPPVLAFSPASLDFGNTVVGSSATLTVNVTNLSTTDTVLVGGVFTTSTFVFNAYSPKCTVPLAPGMSCSVLVTFNPALIQAYSGTVTFQPQASGCGGCVVNYPAQTLTVKGNSIAQPPVLSFSPATVDFGNQLIGTSAAQSVTVTNISTTDTVVLSSVVTTSFAYHAQLYTCVAPLAPGMSCVISFIFTPTMVQTYNSTAIILVQPSGCGGCPISYPTANFPIVGVGVAPPPVMTISPAVLDFGNQAINSKSAARSVTVTNISPTDTITLTTFSIPALGFGVDIASCPQSLTPGASCTVAYTFNPTTAQSYSVMSTIQAQPVGCGGCVRNYPLASFLLTGVGVQPVSSLTPASMSFTTTTGTTSAAQTATLTNLSGPVFAIYGISVAGASTNDYHQTNNCGLFLAVGASCTISVTFTPTSAGNDPGTLTVSSNDPTSPQTIALSGNGTSTANFVLSSSTPAQTVIPGGAAQFSLAVTAQNGASIPAVTLTATGLPPGATATFSQSSVTPGSSSATSTLTIQTAYMTGSSNGSAWPLTAPVLALIGWFFVPGKRRRRLIPLSVLLFASLSGLAAVTGCGVSYPPAQSYTITVTATVGSVQQTATVQLTVE
jgi:hypothetical protein